MKIVLVAGFFNHYMNPFIEELNQIEGCEAYFFETEQMSELRKKGGFKLYQESEKFIRAWKDDASKQKMEQLVMDADIVIYSSLNKKLEWQRLRQNKITFEMSERPLKKGWLNMFSKVCMKNQYYYHTKFYNKPVYMLALSAYLPNDEYRMHAFKNRCYKFGYFSRIPDHDIDKLLSEKPKDKIRIFWCARFIDWKHPELPVLLAERLVKDGYNFEINMVGSGKLYGQTEKLIKRKSLEKYVHLLGVIPNDEVLKKMSQHHIFLLTSDHHEGWGVVLNESMGQGCCPVAADEIGAVPYLIRHQENGVIFKARDLDSLHNSIVELMKEPYKIENLAREAYKTVSETWNPKGAAHRFYGLASSMLKGDRFPYEEGICSKAEPLNYWKK